METTPTNPTKILIIRFSSLGDIIQNLTAVDHLQARFPGSEIHWVTRQDFADLVKTHPGLKRVWVMERPKGLPGLIQLARQLKAEGFTHVYDAHSNVRSHIVSWVLGLPGSGRTKFFVRRSKERIKRWLLFRWRWNLLPWPYHGAQSYVWPLKKWQVEWNPQLSHGLQLPDLKKETRQMLKWPSGQTWVLAPSAAWEMKRWPVEHWQHLIRLRPKDNFFILGGPQDHFCEQLEQAAPERVQNLAGLLSWLESARLVSECRGLISGDTGVLHLGDYLGRPTWALLGPTAFGFPSWANSHTVDISLPCRPCTKDGRGLCRLTKTPRKCLIDIDPERIASELNQTTP